MFGGEIVLAGDRVLGRVTSAGYGYTVGRNMLLRLRRRRRAGARRRTRSR